jgi:hypothetical protein
MLPEDGACSGTSYNRDLRRIPSGLGRKAEVKVKVKSKSKSKSKVTVA